MGCHPASVISSINLKLSSDTHKTEHESSSDEDEDEDEAVAAASTPPKPLPLILRYILLIPCHSMDGTPPPQNTWHMSCQCNIINTIFDFVKALPRRVVVPAVSASALAPAPASYPRLSGIYIYIHYICVGGEKMRIRPQAGLRFASGLPCPCPFPVPGPHTIKDNMHKMLKFIRTS